MQRRDFLRSSTLITAAAALPYKRLWSQSADARIEILMDEPIGTISPQLYGQFTEHIGGVIYDGVWVGKESQIPNRDGVRAALIDRLREMRVPIIRWPGGCFADSYDWRDGIGPVDKRPTRTNFWEVDPDAARLHESGPQIFESNQFGTTEFMQFCRLSGAEPYVAANVRSLTALDFARWVEYCNSPTDSTTLARVRGAAGFPDPFRVRYWGIGNESWGCGGNFLPEDYAAEFRRFTTWVPEYGVDLQFIGSGPNGDDIDWTHRVFEQLYSQRPYDNPHFVGWSVHHYAWNLSRGRTQDWNAAKGDALRFDAVDWYELLHESNRIEQIIHDQWAVMSQYDPEHRVKLVVDEYGPWYREGTELGPTHIFGQQITMGDALATALTLDIFNRNPEKVAIATCAQLINNLNALFLAHEDHFIVTPNFHVFTMYAGHQGGQALRAEISAPEVHYQRDGQPAAFWGLDGSASSKGNRLTLTMVNPDLENSRSSEVALRGAAISDARASVLASNDTHAHNTFEQPNAVQPRALEVSQSTNLLHVTFPPASVSSIEIDVA